MAGNATFFSLQLERLSKEGDLFRTQLMLLRTPPRKYPDHANAGQENIICYFASFNNYNGVTLKGRLQMGRDNVKRTLKSGINFIFIL